LAGTDINDHIYKKCTPAMAAGLTDHIWNTAEILLWKPALVPV